MKIKRRRIVGVWWIIWTRLVLLLLVLISGFSFFSGVQFLFRGLFSSSPPSPHFAAIVWGSVVGTFLPMLFLMALRRQYVYIPADKTPPAPRPCAFCGEDLGAAKRCSNCGARAERRQSAVQRALPWVVWMSLVGISVGFFFLGLSIILAIVLSGSSGQPGPNLARMFWWSMLAMFLPIWLLVLLRDWRHYFPVGPKPQGECSMCGYCLTGNVSGICPECGTEVGD